MISDNIIAICLHELAKAVYNITNKTELARFTSHFILLGLCVVLNIVNKQNEYIKFRLRWPYDAFVIYFRNIPVLAK